VKIKHVLDPINSRSLHSLHIESTGDAWNLRMEDDTLDDTAAQRKADPAPPPHKTQNRKTRYTPLPEEEFRTRRIGSKICSTRD